MMLGKLESHMQKNETRLQFVTMYNSKWIKAMNIRPESINYIEENVSTKLMNIGLREDFMNLTSKSREVKAKINECNGIKLKSFCIAKEMSRKQNSNELNWKRHLQTTPPIRS